MVNTITLQIRNTYAKLSPKEWMDFYETMNEAVSRLALKIEFSDAPPAEAGGETACWVFDIERQEEIRDLVTRTRIEYGQEPAAWTQWHTELI